MSTLHEALLTAAQRTPDAIAITSETGHMTYGELAGRSARLAARLRDEGVTAGALVGLCLPRGTDAIVAAVAILRTGGAYVPLDPSYPADRLRFMIDDAGLDRVVTTLASSAGIHMRPDRLVYVDKDGSGGCSAQDDATIDVAAPAIDADSRSNAIAYVIYTSGSTGHPKGVQIRHANVLDRVDGCPDVMITSDDRVLHSFSPSADGSTWEIWGALCSGARLVIPPHGPLTSERIARTLRDNAVTVAVLPTALFHRQVTDDPRSLRSLRCLLVGGEAMNPDAAERALRVNPGLTLVNGYGPTEATVMCTYYTMTSVADIVLPLPIGWPLRNTSVEVVDADLNPVPPGSVGELLVGGSAVAAGYLNRPTLTADRFIGVDDSTGEHRYRTGDLVRMRPDGALEFHGRRDDQVKVNSHRIELGEIEFALRARTGVLASVVARREDNHGRPCLAAYVVLDDDVPHCPADLREHLAGLLPAVMMPATFTRLECLPLTPAGKVDRAALPDPVRARDSVIVAHTPPRGELEISLAKLIADHVGVMEVGAHDDFVAIGGDSLAAIRITADIGTRYGVDVPVNVLLLGATVATIARMIGARTAGSMSSGEIPRVGNGKPALASAAQHGLWFHQRTHPGSTAYNEYIALRLRGPLRIDLLRRCIDELVARHHALRTVLVPAGDVLRQVVREPYAVWLDEVDAIGASPNDLTETVTTLVRQPYDLATGPLFRAHLLQLGTDDHLLLFTAHHAVLDGWSTDVLLRDLGQLYDAFLGGEPSPLPPVAIQFTDFATWEQDSIVSGAIEDDLAYWKTRMAGAPPELSLPVNRPRPARSSGNGGHVHTWLSSDLVAMLDHMARNLSATRFMTILAALQVVLARHSGCDDVVVGTALAGQTRPELADTVGYMVSTLPLRTDLSDRPTFGELVGRAKEAVAEAHAHRRAPFQLLAQHLGADWRNSQPLLQVMLLDESVYRHQVALGEMSGTVEYYDVGIAKLDLTLNLVPESDGRLRIIAEYSSDVFEEATISRLLCHLRTVIEAAVAMQDSPVNDLPMLTETETHQILHEWQAAEPAPAECTGIAELVGSQAKEDPDRIAMVDSDMEVTYAELVQTADRLAVRLAQEFNVRPGTRVAVCLPKGIDAIVAYLAILSLRAAYVPLDAAYPEHRLRFMIGDAAPIAVIGTDDMVRGVGIHADLAVERSSSGGGRTGARPAHGTDPNDIAYVIYTSGSSGNPKGVQVTHRSVLDLVGSTDVTELGPGDRVLQYASLSFDISVWDIWTTLCNGATLVFAPPPPVHIADLGRFVREQRINQAMLPTALFHQLADEDPSCFSAFNCVVVIGEVLDDSAARIVLRHTPGLRLVNGYGPTEATVLATSHAMTDPRDAAMPIPIGRPRPGVEVYPVDRWGKLAPVGVAGELLLGGPALAESYLNNPDLTADRFVVGLLRPGQRLYRTGDLVRWRADGMLEFIGRSDHQVKINGHRIELGEVEAVLRTHPAVAAAAVVRRTNNTGFPYLAAYVAPFNGSYLLNRAILRHWLAERIPGYMVPAVIAVVDALPMTANGKVDRAKLPELGEQETPDDAASEPRTGEGSNDLILTRVAQVWSDVTMVAEIAPSDRLFDIGGASLHVTRIHSRLADEFALADLEMTDLFAYPTLSEYANHVSRLVAAAQASRP